jgi:hypothetical protein
VTDTGHNSIQNKRVAELEDCKPMQEILPRTPGRDFSGIVVEGKQLEGGEVWGTGAALGIARDGAHAEHVTVPIEILFRKPASLSMAFELSQFGIGMKTVEPGGMKTDFFTRSFDTGRHEAYDQLVDKVMGMIRDPNRMETYSSPAEVAEVVYEAATDGKDKLRYIAGNDAKAIYAMRLRLGEEAFRKAMAQQFFGT